MGAPRKPIDLKQLESLCSIQCTDKEIAHFFGVSTKTIQTRKKQKKFREAMERGKASGKMSLRRAQWNRAITHEDTRMLIWMGKQHLDQTDKQIVETKEFEPMVLEVMVPDDEGDDDNEG